MDNINTTLQTSKKILIFIYIICIFIFIFFSMTLLYLKSNYFAAMLDINISRALNQSDTFVSYRKIDGDLLSKLTLEDITAIPKKSRNAPGSIDLPSEILFGVKKIEAVINPLSHIFNYLTFSSIPIDSTVSGAFFKTRGGTVEIGMLTARLLFSYIKGRPSPLTLKAAFDFSSPWGGTLATSAVRLESAYKENPGENKWLNLTLTCDKMIAKPGAFNLDNSPVSFIISELAADIDYPALKELTSNAMRAIICGGSFTVDKFRHTPSSGSVEINLGISGFNTSDFFRKNPLLETLVMSDSMEAAISYRGNINDLRAGSMEAAITFADSSLLEYKPDRNWIFTNQGFGDFVTSLGLGPDLTSKAGTIEIKAGLSARKLKLNKISVRSSNYT
ncbi:MAG TPA: hypothetical protein PKK26_12050, partial [Candidatus Wallbacteria bacterium]|nr:hypothetical protein [Candidatus Wallbacteria bacterium]